MSDTNTEPSTEPSTRNPLMCLEGPNAPLYRSKVECGHCSHRSEYYNAQGEVRRRCPCCRLNFGAPPVTMRKKPKGVTGISQAALRDMLKYGHNVSHLITDDSDEEEDEGELVEMPNFEEMFAGVTEFIIPDTWESLRITACETYGTTPHPIYGNFYTIRRKKDKSSATASEEKRKKKTETAVVPYQFVSYNDKAFHGIDVPEEAKVPKPWKQSKLIIEISYRRCWCCGTGGFDSALQRICTKCGRDFDPSCPLYWEYLTEIGWAGWDDFSVRKLPDTIYYPGSGEPPIRIPGRSVIVRVIGDQTTGLYERH